MSERSLQSVAPAAVSDPGLCGHGWLGCVSFSFKMDDELRFQKSSLAFRAWMFIKFQMILDVIHT